MIYIVLIKRWQKSEVNRNPLSNIGIKKRARGSILWHNGRIATLLNKMREDGLVAVNEEIVNGRPRKYYKLNPKILQSPVRDGTYFDEEGLVHHNISLLS
jgi:hypothetical protein